MHRRSANTTPAPRCRARRRRRRPGHSARSHQVCGLLPRRLVERAVDGDLGLEPRRTHGQLPVHAGVGRGHAGAGGVARVSAARRRLPAAPAPGADPAAHRHGTVADGRRAPREPSGRGRRVGPVSSVSSPKPCEASRVAMRPTGQARRLRILAYSKKEQRRPPGCSASRMPHDFGDETLVGHVSASTHERRAAASPPTWPGRAHDVARAAGGRGAADRSRAPTPSDRRRPSSRGTPRARHRRTARPRRPDEGRHGRQVEGQDDGTEDVHRSGLRASCGDARPRTRRRAVDRWRVPAASTSHRPRRPSHAR